MHSRLALALLIVLAGCSRSDDAIDTSGKTFDAVAPQEVVTMMGTEPFWNLHVEAGEAVYSTPDNPGGTRFAAARFAGNNGLSFNGTLDGRSFTAMLTPGTCSDGMSNRSYPYVATISLGGETLRGCGYTTGQPFTGDEAP